MRNTIEETSPGVWLVRFADKSTVDAPFCEHLIPPLIEAARSGSLVLLACPPADLRLVPQSMVQFWLDAFTKRGARVHAIGLVTESMAVRGVLKGAALFLAAVRMPIRADSFATEEEARRWSLQHAQPRVRP